MAALEERARPRGPRDGARRRVLAHWLEDLPAAEPGQRPAEEAARRACDLLLAAEPRMPGPQAGTDDRDT